MPCGVDFPRSLASGILKFFSAHPPEVLARVNIVVNTKRMRLRLLEEFVSLGSILIPNVHVVSDLSELIGTFKDPNPKSHLQYRFELMVLVQKLIEQQPDLASKSALYDLTDNLAKLIDELQGENVAPSIIKKLNVEDQSGHWQRILHFVDIVTTYLEKRNLEPDSEGFQRNQVRALLKGWEEFPPENYIFIAGSTGSRGTTLELIKGIYGLNKGVVVLPGFDFHIPETVLGSISDPLIGEDHPQYRFVKMLKGLNVKYKDVGIWPTGSPPSIPRNKLISLALRPAPFTDSWMSEGPKLECLDRACEGLSLFEAENQREEALAIAMVLRKAADLNKRAALVTPDRRLARQVTAELLRWGIIPDDSAGLSFHLTLPGRFLRKVSAIFNRSPTASELIAILKNPICHSDDVNRGKHLRLVTKLETFLRKNTIIDPTVDHLHRFSKENNQEFSQKWVKWLSIFLGKFQNEGQQELGYWLCEHISNAEYLAVGCDPLEEKTSGSLWQNDAGEMAKKIVDNIFAVASSAPSISSSDYNKMLNTIFSSYEVRNSHISHDNILIWGTLEARANGTDLLILSGLNEGIWPAQPEPDQWMNRKMRIDAGLLLPERRIGLSAHDFQQAMGANEVWITRSKRNSESETTPSRWLNRLINLLAGLNSNGGKLALENMRSRGSQHLLLLNELEKTKKIKKPSRPEPIPPLKVRPKKLSVTEIKTLIRDPYSIYARHILKIEPLERLDKFSSYTLRGTVYHSIFEQFVMNWNSDADLKSHQENLEKMASDVIKVGTSNKILQNFWRKGINDISLSFIKDEIERQQEATPSAFERSGKLYIRGLNFEISGKADRIDLNKNGGAIIYDYKSGTLPSLKQQVAYDKQLYLLSLILQNGGFEGISSTKVDAAFFVPIKPNLKKIHIPVDLESVEEFEVKLGELLSAYLTLSTGFKARRALFLKQDYSPYDQISRYGEWDTSDKCEIEIL